MVGSSSMASSRPLGGLASSRVAVLSSMKLLLAGITNIPLIRAAPLRFLPATMLLADEGLPPKSPKLWIYMVVAMTLVLLGGAFAGLTIALMGQVMLIIRLPARLDQANRNLGRNISTSYQGFRRRLGAQTCLKCPSVAQERQALGPGDITSGKCHHQRDFAYRT